MAVVILATVVGSLVGASLCLVTTAGAVIPGNLVLAYLIGGLCGFSVTVLLSPARHLP
jgi:hypothetical protein